MNDLISRQAVIDAIEEDKRNGNDSCFASNYDAQCFKQIIKELPSVTPAPKIGRWKKFDVGYGCSECSLCTNKRGIDFYRYCPNCGAKMEWVEE